MPARLFHAEDDWYEWQPESSLGCGASVFVRVAPREDGRLGVTELRVVGALSSELLRAIPVGRIEAAANAQLADFVMAESLPAVHRSARAPAKPVEGGWDLVDTEPHTRPRSARIPARLATTDSRGRGDEFYAAVAGIYRELAQTSSRPAVAIAEANDAPVTTAHRWIKEARRRGFLGPGHPGKAG